MKKVVPTTLPYNLSPYLGYGQYGLHGSLALAQSQVIASNSQL